MICLPCAKQHPNFTPLRRPELLVDVACCACKRLKPCLPNARLGLPDRLLTVHDAFRLIASEFFKPT